MSEAFIIVLNEGAVTDWDNADSSMGIQSRHKFSSKIPDLTFLFQHLENNRQDFSWMRQAAAFRK